jgi:hypothetical protein
MSTQDVVTGGIGAGIVTVISAIAYKWVWPLVTAWLGREHSITRERREQDLIDHITTCKEQHAKLNEKLESHDKALSDGSERFRRQEDATALILSSLGEVKGQIGTVISMMSSGRKD